MKKPSQHQQSIKKSDSVNIDDTPPQVQFINLSDLVGTEIYNSVSQSDLPLEVHEFWVREKLLRFFTPSLRTLWQSAGQEYIEPDLLDFIQDIPKGGLYFDVGASTGVFALYAAARGVETVCFEPEIENLHVMNVNSYLNHQTIGKFFSAFNIALSNKSQISHMNPHSFAGGTHQKILDSVKQSTRGSFYSVYEQKVLTFTLDDFCQLLGKRPTDIKIDVDGSELDVIEGAQRVLSDSILTRVFVELSEKDPASVTVLRTLDSFGFEIFSKKQVQHYPDLHNFVLKRARKIR